MPSKLQQLEADQQEDLCRDFEDLLVGSESGKPVAVPVIITFIRLIAE